MEQKKATQRKAENTVLQSRSKAPSKGSLRDLFPGRTLGVVGFVFCGQHCNTCC